MRNLWLPLPDRADPSRPFPTYRGWLAYVMAAKSLALRYVPMPLFFFHVRDSMDAADDEGLELPDVQAAKQEALRGARSLACEEVARGELHLHHHIAVADAEGKIVFDMPFSEAVKIRP